MQEIKWSYSGLKDFVNCPKQYQEVKVLKRFTKFPTKEMRYGTEVHSALEDYVKDGTPLLKNYERFQKQLDPLRDMEGIKFQSIVWHLLMTKKYALGGLRIIGLEVSLT